MFTMNNLVHKVVVRQMPTIVPQNGKTNKDFYFATSASWHYEDLSVVVVVAVVCTNAATIENFLADTGVAISMHY